MANTLNAGNNTFRLTTAYNSSSPTDGGSHENPIYVKSMVLQGATAGNVFVLQNFSDTGVLFEGKATNANSDQWIIEEWWPKGFKLASIAGGTLFINCD